MSKKSIDFMIVGVGGQGTLLASKLLSTLLLSEGYDVKVSEVHGMSQRGGSVVTYVRCGERIYSPIIDKGCADFLIAFEKIEAARYAAYLKKDGIAVVNTQEIDSMPVIIGAAEYPSDALLKLSALGVSIDAFDALSLAEKAGSVKAVNIVLMGRISTMLDIPLEKWENAIRTIVKPAFVDINLRAFALGRSL